jgi:hypothetical protein
LLNPTLEILIDDDWVNVYDLIDLEDIIENHAVTATGFIQQIHHHRQRLKKDPNAVFDQTAFWKELYEEMEKGKVDNG